jgi:hypothetical protein
MSYTDVKTFQGALGEIGGMVKDWIQENGIKDARITPVHLAKCGEVTDEVIVTFKADLAPTATAE